MNHRLQTMKWTALAGMAMVAGSGYGSAIRVTLSRGTVLPVVLNQNLSSDHSFPGDHFTANVKDNGMGLPNGTTVEGVVKSTRVKTDSKPGTLSLAFTRLVLPDGKSYPIDGSPIGLDDKSVTTVHGHLRAKPGVKDQRLTYIGYGAGAGFVIGLLGGSNRVVEKTAIGGAIGYLASALAGGNKHKTNNVLLKSGTTIGLKMERQATVYYRTN